MPNDLDQQIRRGLQVVFQAGGQQAQWFRYSGVSGGAPELGIESTRTYKTAQCALIFQDWTLTEAQRAGGQLSQGALKAFTRQNMVKSDMVRYNAHLYRLNGDPTMQFLGGVMLYRIRLDRAD